MKGGGGGVIIIPSIVHARRPPEHRSLHPYNAGTAHVGFSPTRQAILLALKRNAWWSVRRVEWRASCILQRSVAKRTLTPCAYLLGTIYTFGRERGCIHFMRSHLAIPAMPERCTSGFHRPDRHHESGGGGGGQSPVALGTAPKSGRVRRVGHARALRIARQGRGGGGRLQRRLNRDDDDRAR